MALWAEVVARHTTDELVGLTQGDSTASTIDTARADKAVLDAQADFLTYTQAVYDNDEAQHVVAAVAGVIAYLQKRGGSASSVATESVADYRKDCERLAQSTTRRRVMPKSKSPLTQTDEGEGVTGDLKPDFDREHFDSQQLQNPDPSGGLPVDLGNR